MPGGHNLQLKLVTMVATCSVACAGPARHQYVIRMWLADTGCGRAIVYRSNARMLKTWNRFATRPISFSTANGATDASEILELCVEEFGEDLPYIMESTLGVISAGKRCMKHVLPSVVVWEAAIRRFTQRPDGHVGR